LILRFYEWAGKETEVRLNLENNVQLAFETDLMERTVSTAPSQHGLVTIHAKPYEIKTVKLELPAVPRQVPGPQSSRLKK